MKTHFTCVPPCLIMLDAPIIGSNYHYKYAAGYNFPSIAGALTNCGFTVKGSGPERNFDISGQKARENLFEGTDTQGIPH